MHLSRKKSEYSKSLRLLQTRESFHICWPPFISASLAAGSSVIWYNSFSATCKTTSERANTRDTKLARHPCRGLLYATCVTYCHGTDRLFWLTQWGFSHFPQSLKVLHLTELEELQWLPWHWETIQALRVLAFCTACMRRGTTAVLRASAPLFMNHELPWIKNIMNIMKTVNRVKTSMNMQCTKHHH